MKVHKGQCDTVYRHLFEISLTTMNNEKGISYSLEKRQNKHIKINCEVPGRPEKTFTKTLAAKFCKNCHFLIFCLEVPAHTVEQ